MLLTAPILFILFALSYEVIEIIFTSKWIPALPALIIFGCLSLLGHFTTVGDNVLKGLGKVKEDFKIMSIWTIFSWIISILGMFFLGYNAIAFGWTLSAIIPAIWITKIINKGYPIDFKAILNPLLSSAFSAFIISILKIFLPINIYILILLGGIGLLFYLAILFVLEGKRWWNEMLDLIKTNK
jgi:O-antigen/teichoic acid export membrane protein